MQLGAHAGLITPPVPVHLGGYGDRTGQAEGVHDDLHVRSLFFGEGEQRFGLITCDLLAVDRQLTRQVREAASAATGIAPEAIMLAPSHTHSGPAVRRLMYGEVSPEYMAWLPRALAGSLYQASRQLREVSLAAAVDRVRGLGSNRTDPDRPFDDTVRVVAAAGDCGWEAVLLNYGCHPTVMGAENLLITADWPGAAVSALRRALGGQVWVGFAQGFAGDVSTRFVRRAQSFAEVRRLGSILAGKALELLGNLEPGPTRPASLAVRSRTLRLQPRPLPSEAESRARIAQADARVQALTAAGAPHGEIRLAHTALQGARAEAAWRGLLDQLEFEAEVQAVRLDDQTALVAVPGEPFSSLGEEIRRRSPFAVTMTIGYANGYVGYLPDRQTWQRGGYEASSAYTAPGSGERLVEVALELLAELKAEVS